MIVKKMKQSKAFKKTPQKHARDLIKYVLTAEKSQPQDDVEKALCFGASNMGTIDMSASAIVNAGYLSGETIGLIAEQTASSNPLTHYMISWQSHEHPSNEQFQDAFNIFLKELGMSEHQAIYGVHKNTENLHMHIIINRIHPKTLKSIEINNGYDKLAGHKAIAMIEYAQCWQREKNSLFIYDEKKKRL